MSSGLGPVPLSMRTGDGAALLLVVRPVDTNSDASLDWVRDEIAPTEPSLRISRCKQAERGVNFGCYVARYFHERGPFKLLWLYGQC
jgi:hypothetical protein